jgi:hypothetical protein
MGAKKMSKVIVTKTYHLKILIAYIYLRHYLGMTFKVTFKGK